MNLNPWAVVAAVVAVPTYTTNHLLADDTADTVDSLKKQIEQLDQKVRILERNRELDMEEKEAKAKEALKISVDERGFAVGSADGNNLIKLRGLLQVDSRFFLKDAAGNNNDSFVLRRARPIFEGTVFRDFDFQFVPEFGGSSVQILEANINYRYSPELQLRVGKYKSPFGLEQLQS